jgi:hypothetical protein
MYAPIFFSQPLTVEQVVCQILAFRRISPMDQDLLRVVTLKGLTQREGQLVRRLQEALLQGNLLVV